MRIRTLDKPSLEACKIYISTTQGRSTQSSRSGPVLSSVTVWHNTTQGRLYLKIASISQFVCCSNTLVRNYICCISDSSKILPNCNLRFALGYCVTRTLHMSRSLLSLGTSHMNSMSHFIVLTYVCVGLEPIMC